MMMLMVVLATLSCSKDEDELVEGNIAPPDNTIEEVVVNNYVQKLYIALLGRKATIDEKNSSVNALKASNLSVESRYSLISTVLANIEYFDNEYAIMRSDYLNNADSASYAEAKGIMELAITLTVNPIEIAFWENELKRIEPLIALENDLASESKSIKEAHKVIVDNYVYDLINMGSENYVVSLFQNFMHRYPTDAELEAGKNLFDQKPDVLFAISAKSREELVALFFNDLEYYEGQVITSFLRFLYREPTDDEIVLLANQYKNGGDYKSIQKYILALDEYVGIE